MSFIEIALPMLIWGDGTLTDGFVYTKNQDGSVDYTNIVGDAKVNIAM